MSRKKRHGLRVLVSVLATCLALAYLLFVCSPGDGPAEAAVYGFLAMVVLIVGGLITLFLVLDWLLPRRRS